MLSLGSDPEFMIMKDGKHYSAIPIVKGSITSKIARKGHFFYWDNVLAECAIKPARSKAEMVDNFRECFTEFADIVKPYKLVAQASQMYPDSELTTKESRTAGCAPDMCAYEVRKKKPPCGIIEQTNFRTGGGHVHIGHEILHDSHWESVIGVRLMDLFIGIPALFMDHDPTSAKRREVYGQAGRYRPKPYGLEYRSLGNFWLASPTLVSLIGELCKFVVDYLEARRFEKFYEFNEDVFNNDSKRVSSAYKCIGYKERDLRNCLDKNDKDAARKYMKIIESEMPKELYAKITKACEPTQYDFYKEWGIE